MTSTIFAIVCFLVIAAVVLFSVKLRSMVNKTVSNAEAKQLLTPDYYKHGMELGYYLCKLQQAQASRNLNEVDQYKRAIEKRATNLRNAYFSQFRDSF